MRIVLTGGGTGGHIMPFEAIIEAIRSAYKEQKDTLPKFLDPETLEIAFVGVSTSEGDELFRHYAIPVHHVPSGKVRRYASPLTIIDLLFRLPVGIVLAFIRMWQIMPDVVVSKGGYGSVPAVLAATFYHIPVLLHESDSIPGSANRFLLRFASGITLGFAASKEYLSDWSYKLFVTGTPIRIVAGTNQKNHAKESFQIPPSEKVLLIMGGSQGAKQINEAFLSCIAAIIEIAAIIHITGPNHHEAVSKVAAEFLSKSPRLSLYKSFPFLSGEKMTSALLAADAAVTRAGASSLAEIAHLKIPSLIIPLDGAASDHQRKNALAFEAAGAALVLDPNNVSPHLLQQGIERLLKDTELTSTLQKNLQALDFPRAALDIASLTFQFASGFRPTKK